MSRFNFKIAPSKLHLQFALFDTESVSVNPRVMIIGIDFSGEKRFQHTQIKVSGVDLVGESREKYLFRGSVFTTHWFSCHGYFETRGRKGWVEIGQKKEEDPLLKAIVVMENCNDAAREQFFRELRYRYCLHCGSMTPESECFCYRDE